MTSCRLFFQDVVLPSKENKTEQKQCWSRCSSRWREVISVTLLTHFVSLIIIYYLLEALLFSVCVTFYKFHISHFPPLGVPQHKPVMFAEGEPENL